MRQVTLTPLSDLKPYSRNARTHSRRQIKELAKLIKRFGFTNPILAADDGTIIAGHRHFEAAKLLGLETVPVTFASPISTRMSARPTLWRITGVQESGWDRELLSLELKDLQVGGFEDLDLTGFSVGEIQTIFDEAAEREEPTTGPDDTVPDLAEGHPVTRPGDLWALGPHRLICGEAACLRPIPCS